MKVKSQTLFKFLYIKKNHKKFLLKAAFACEMCHSQKYSCMNKIVGNFVADTIKEN